MQLACGGERRLAALRGGLVQGAGLLQQSRCSRLVHRCQHMAEHEDIGVVQANHARAKAGTLPRTPGSSGHQLVAGVAIKQHQFGEDALPAGPFIRHQLKQIFRRDPLADRPVAHAVPFALAPRPRLVDLVMRMQPGERVELKGKTRMAGTHDAMGDHAIGRAHVAGQAQARPGDRLIGRVHSVLEVVLVRHALVRVRVEP